MKKEIINFERQKLFNHYNKNDNPFIYLTTKIDITNIYHKCKNYYPSIAYLITLAVNQIDNFKYRYEDNKIYKYDILKPNFTHLFNDHNIGFFTCDNKETYTEFLNEYQNMKDKFLNTNKSYANSDQGEIWFSFVPWYNVSSLITPFNKTTTIPQFIWDKFNFENNKCYINLTIMVHHGFIDGYHIGLFLEKLNNIIENIDKYI